MASATITRAPAPEAPVDSEQRVTPLELFFDLVFVFAVTQVTSLLGARPTWTGIAQGLAVLALLWWAWTAYAWLTNTIDPDVGPARLALFAAMAAMLVVSLAVPRAFGDDALVFGLAYAAVRGLHLVLYLVASRGDPALRRVVGRLARPALAASALIVAASAFGGAAQAACWLVAILVDYAGVALSGTRGWRVHPGHFAERHGLIVIIALGESIVAVGVGANGLRLDLGLVAAAVLGVGVVAALWWIYFDVVALVAERRFRAATGEARVRIARDSYTYLHFPMVAGIVLFALGVKKAIPSLEGHLKLVPAVALCAGVALYLLAHVAFRLRNVHTLNRQRCVAAALCLALIPVATVLPALGALAALSAVCVALVTYEVVHFADARARVRGAG